MGIGGLAEVVPVFAHRACMYLAAVSCKWRGQLLRSVVLPQSSAAFVSPFCVVLCSSFAYSARSHFFFCEDLAKIVFRLGRGVSVNNFTNALFVSTLGEVIAMTWRGCCAQLSQSLTYSCLRFVSVLIASSS